MSDAANTNEFVFTFPAPRARDPNPRFDVKPSITISSATEQDLPAIAEGQWAAFGEGVFAVIEPPHIRAPHPERVSRTVHRLRAVLNSPHTKLDKACLPDGTLVGVAMWHVPGAPICHAGQRDASTEYTEQDRDAWEGVDLRAWKAWHGGDSETRKRIMGSQAHWYLAPLWVLPKYQGLGIGTKLIKHVIDVADASTPPMPMYLEAAPNARPIYESLGFVWVEGIVLVRNAPSKSVSA